jgi:hypothetical protein
LIVAAGEGTLPPELRRAGQDAKIAEYFHENLLINVNRVQPDIESETRDEPKSLGGEMRFGEAV